MFGEDLDLCQTSIECPSRIPSDGTGILIRTTEGWVGSKNNRVPSLDSFHQIPNSPAKLTFNLFVTSKKRNPEFTNSRSAAKCLLKPLN